LSAELNCEAVKICKRIVYKNVLRLRNFFLPFRAEFLAWFVSHDLILNCWSDVDWLCWIDFTNSSLCLNVSGCAWNSNSSWLLRWDFFRPKNTHISVKWVDLRDLKSRLYFVFGNICWSRLYLNWSVQSVFKCLGWGNFFD